MTNYIPHRTKKKQALKKKELKLVQAIKANIAYNKLVALAEEVRQAQIRVINAKSAQLKPSESTENETLSNKFHEDHEYWDSITDREVIDKYKSRI